MNGGNRLPSMAIKRVVISVSISILIVSCANKPVEKELPKEGPAKQSAATKKLPKSQENNVPEKDSTQLALQKMADNMANRVSISQSRESIAAASSSTDHSREIAVGRSKEKMDAAQNESDSKKLAKANELVKKSQQKSVNNNHKTVQNRTNMQLKSAEKGVDKSDKMKMSPMAQEGGVNESMRPSEEVLQLADGRDLDRSSTGNKGPEKVTLPSFTLESLPLQVNGWTLDFVRSARYVKGSCFIKSPTIDMPDGQGGTKAYWEISRHMAVMATLSNIDLSYSGTGLTIGDQQWPLTTLLTETAVDFSADSDAIVAAMLVNDTVNASIGFWPTWPVTHAYQGSWNFRAFPKAWEALKMCERLWLNP